MFHAVLAVNALVILGMENNLACTAQGDTYEELGVTVTDKNEDESTRTVKIEYSEPFGELTGGKRDRIENRMILHTTW